MGLLGKFNKDVKPAKGYQQLDFKDKERVTLKVDETKPVTIMDNNEVGFLNCTVADGEHKHHGKQLGVKLYIEAKTDAQARRHNQFLKAFFSEESLMNDSYDPSDLRGKIFKATHRKWKMDEKEGSYWSDFKCEQSSSSEDNPF